MLTNIDLDIYEIYCNLYDAICVIDKSINNIGLWSGNFIEINTSERDNLERMSNRLDIDGRL